MMGSAEDQQSPTKQHEGDVDCLAGKAGSRSDRGKDPTDREQSQPRSNPGVSNGIEETNDSSVDATGVSATHHGDTTSRPKCDENTVAFDDTGIAAHVETVTSVESVVDYQPAAQCGQVTGSRVPPSGGPTRQQVVNQMRKLRRQIDQLFDEEERLTTKIDLFDEKNDLGRNTFLARHYLELTEQRSEFFQQRSELEKKFTALKGILHTYPNNGDAESNARPLSNGTSSRRCPPSHTTSNREINHPPQASATATRESMPPPNADSSTRESMPPPRANTTSSRESMPPPMVHTSPAMDSPPPSPARIASRRQSDEFSGMQELYGDVTPIKLQFDVDASGQPVVNEESRPSPKSYSVRGSPTALAKLKALKEENLFKTPPTPPPRRMRRRSGQRAPGASNNMRLRGLPAASPGTSGQENTVSNAAKSSEHSRSDSSDGTETSNTGLVLGNINVVVQGNPSAGIPIHSSSALLATLLTDTAPQQTESRAQSSNDASNEGDSNSSGLSKRSTSPKGNTPKKVKREHGEPHGESSLGQDQPPCQSHRPSSEAAQGSDEGTGSVEDDDNDDKVVEWDSDEDEDDDDIKYLLEEEDQEFDNDEDVVGDDNVETTGVVQADPPNLVKPANDKDLKAMNARLKEKHSLKKKFLLEYLRGLEDISKEVTILVHNYAWQTKYNQFYLDILCGDEKREFTATLSGLQKRCKNERSKIKNARGKKIGHETSSLRDDCLNILNTLDSIFVDLNTLILKRNAAVGLDAYDDERTKVMDNLFEFRLSMQKPVFDQVSALEEECVQILVSRRSARIRGRWDLDPPEQPHNPEQSNRGETESDCSGEEDLRGDNVEDEDQQATLDAYMDKLVNDRQKLLEQMNAMQAEISGTANLVRNINVQENNSSTPNNINGTPGSETFNNLHLLANIMTNQEADRLREALRSTKQRLKLLDERKEFFTIDEYQENYISLRLQVDELERRLQGAPTQSVSPASLSKPRPSATMSNPESKISKDNLSSSSDNSSWLNNTENSEHCTSNSGIFESTTTSVTNFGSNIVTTENFSVNANSERNADNTNSDNTLVHSADISTSNSGITKGSNASGSTPNDTKHTSNRHTISSTATASESATNPGCSTRFRLKTTSASNFISISDLASNLHKSSGITAASSSNRVSSADISEDDSNTNGSTANNCATSNRESSDGTASRSNSDKAIPDNNEDTSDNVNKEAGGEGHQSTTPPDSPVHMSALDTGDNFRVTGTEATNNNGEVEGTFTLTVSGSRAPATSRVMPHTQSCSDNNSQRGKVDTSANQVHNTRSSSETKKVTFCERGDTQNEPRVSNQIAGSRSLSDRKIKTLQSVLDETIDQLYHEESDKTSAPKSRNAKSDEESGVTAGPMATGLPPLYLQALADNDAKPIIIGPGAAKRVLDFDDVKEDSETERMDDNDSSDQLSSCLSNDQDAGEAQRASASSTTKKSTNHKNASVCSETSNPDREPTPSGANSVPVVTLTNSLKNKKPPQTSTPSVKTHGLRSVTIWKPTPSNNYQKPDTSSRIEADAPIVITSRRIGTITNTDSNDYPELRRVMLSTNPPASTTTQGQAAKDIAKKIATVDRQLKELEERKQFLSPSEYSPHLDSLNAYRHELEKRYKELIQAGESEDADINVNEVGRPDRPTSRHINVNEEVERPARPTSRKYADNRVQDVPMDVRDAYISTGNAEKFNQSCTYIPRSRKLFFDIGRFKSLGKSTQKSLETLQAEARKMERLMRRGSAKTKQQADDLRKAYVKNAEQSEHYAVLRDTYLREEKRLRNILYRDYYMVYPDSDGTGDSDASSSDDESASIDKLNRKVDRINEMIRDLKDKKDFHTTEEYEAKLSAYTAKGKKWYALLRRKKRADKEQQTVANEDEEKKQHNEKKSDKAASNNEEKSDKPSSATKHNEEKTDKSSSPTQPTCTKSIEDKRRYMMEKARGLYEEACKSLKNLPSQKFSYSKAEYQSYYLSLHNEKERYYSMMAEIEAGDYDDHDTDSSFEQSFDVDVDDDDDSNDRSACALRIGGCVSCTDKDLSKFYQFIPDFKEEEVLLQLEADWPQLNQYWEQSQSRTSQFAHMAADGEREDSSEQAQSPEQSNQPETSNESGELQSSTSAFTIVRRRSARIRERWDLDPVEQPHNPEQSNREETESDSDQLASSQSSASTNTYDRSARIRGDWWRKDPPEKTQSQKQSKQRENVEMAARSDSKQSDTLSHTESASHGSKPSSSEDDSATHFEEASTSTTPATTEHAASRMDTSEANSNRTNGRASGQNDGAVRRTLLPTFTSVRAPYELLGLNRQEIYDFLGRWDLPADQYERLWGLLRDPAAPVDDDAEEMDRPRAGNRSRESSSQTMSVDGNFSEENMEISHGSGSECNNNNCNDNMDSKSVNSSLETMSADEGHNAKSDIIEETEAACDAATEKVDNSESDDVNDDVNSNNCNNNQDDSEDLNEKNDHCIKNDVTSTNVKKRTVKMSRLIGRVNNSLHWEVNNCKSASTNGEKVGRSGSNDVEPNQRKDDDSASDDGGKKADGYDSGDMETSSTDSERDKLAEYPHRICHHCKVEFSFAQDLLDHLNTRRPCRTDYLCEDCVIFLRSRRRLTHVRRRRLPVVKFCELCDYKYEWAYEQRASKGGAMARYCTGCTDGWAWTIDWRRHQEMHKLQHWGRVRRERIQLEQIKTKKERESKEKERKEETERKELTDKRAEKQKNAAERILKQKEVEEKWKAEVAQAEKEQAERQQLEKTIAKK